MSKRTIELDLKQGPMSKRRKSERKLISKSELAMKIYNTISLPKEIADLTSSLVDPCDYATGDGASCFTGRFEESDSKDSESGNRLTPGHVGPECNGYCIQKCIERYPAISNVARILNSTIPNLFTTHVASNSAKWDYNAFTMHLVLKRFGKSTTIVYNEGNEGVEDDRIYAIVDPDESNMDPKLLHPELTRRLNNVNDHKEFIQFVCWAQVNIDVNWMELEFTLYYHIYNDTDQTLDDIEKNLSEIENAANQVTKNYFSKHNLKLFHGADGFEFKVKLAL